jgi:threonylcarbamoyladenosine tRNA methylthiotransferase MtaB
VSSFYVENFGCRATQADGAAIEQQFRDRGLERAAAPARADYVVLNTCAVTAAAEQDARRAIRRVLRSNPDCKILVTGCYAQRAPHEVAALPGVAQVIGNSHKDTLAQIALPRKSGSDLSQNREFIPVSDLEGGTSKSRERSLLARGETPRGVRPPVPECRPDLRISAPSAQPRNLSTAGESSENRGHAEIFVSDIFAHTELLAAPVFDSANERTRPNLKIQDGCNNRCSFCIIPSLRGRSRSLAIEDVLREVNELVAAGYREVVLSGINLGRWGRDLSDVRPPEPFSHFERVGIKVSSGQARPSRFEDLVRLLLTYTSVEKLRISSVEPMDWTDSLIRLLAESPRIAKHAHVPMQSGSDSVLRRMHRKYRPWHYREKIGKIRAAMPDAAIGADVMVGFPGETDAEFEETRRMILDLPFTYLHVFTFSARPGTPAAAMGNQVPVNIARERNRILRELGDKSKLKFMRRFIGRELQAITLNVTHQTAGDHWTEALTDNYLKMRVRGKQEPNQWLRTEVRAVEDGTLLADESSDIRTSLAAREVTFPPARQAPGTRW